MPGVEARNVGRVAFGRGSLARLSTILENRRREAASGGTDDRVLFVVDDFFSSNPETIRILQIGRRDHLEYVSATEEPTTEGVDTLVRSVLHAGFSNPASIVAVGEGCCEPLDQRRTGCCLSGMEFGA